MQVLVVGSVAFDDIATPFGTKKNVLGGSASHFSIAASNLVKPKIIAVVGQDFTEKQFKYLQKFGIDTSGIEKSSDKTFHWSGFYEHDMSVAHTKDTQLGAFASFEPKLTDEDKARQVLFLGNIDPDIQLKVVKQMKNPQLIGIDSMNFWIQSKQSALWKVLKTTDIAFLNDTEARMLAGEASLIKAAKKIRAKGPEIVIIKKGEHGALAVSKDDFFVTASFPTEDVFDPTGAGDSFAGGVMSYLASHTQPGKKIPPQTLREAIVWGSALASFAVEGFSTSGIEKAKKTSIESRSSVIRAMTRF